MSKGRFQRRMYRNLGEVSDDIRYMRAHRALIRRAMRELIPADFRERLMLVVTDVNGCRYCSYGHSLAALKVGVPQDQVNDLARGLIPSGAPDEELPALLYAQHWAESNAKPDIEAVHKLVETYGQEKADAIEILLRMIRAGNLSGNLADYWLYRLSFGLFGLRENEARYSHSE